jgi:hypothetical protein
VLVFSLEEKAARNFVLDEFGKTLLWTFEGLQRELLDAANLHESLAKLGDPSATGRRPCRSGRLTARCTTITARRTVRRRRRCANRQIGRRTDDPPALRRRQNNAPAL